MNYKNYKENINASLGKSKADLLIKNGKVVNFFTGTLEDYDILINNGIIVGLGKYETAKKVIDANGKICTAGFIDSHIHLESCLVSPKNLASLVVPHGSTGLITDPHEIANVCGLKGIDFMLDETKDLDLDVFFMMPSCVPASSIDDNYGPLYSKDLKSYYKNNRVLGLAEMMNYVGVLNADKDIYKKINDAKITDGHAPLLTNETLNAYICAGVMNDHECSNIDEALEKLKKGLYINIRDGSGAHNLKALSGLIKMPYAQRVMLCTDDKHPYELMNDGHIDYIIRESIKLGADPVIALMCASYTPSIYYGLTDRGYIGIGKKADIVILNNLSDINVLCTIKNGKVVYDGVANYTNSIITNKDILSTMNTSLKTIEDFELSSRTTGIEVISGELLTNGFQVKENEDYALVSVFERHRGTNMHATAYLKGYGIKSGAIATTVAHDSHNIIVVGKTKEDMMLAVNEIIKMQGGMIVVNNQEVLEKLPLDIAGLMSSLSIEEVISKIDSLKKHAYSLGVSKGVDPFMNLSFLSLPVIPFVKITALGIFDVINQKFVK